MRASPVCPLVTPARNAHPISIACTHSTLAGATATATANTVQTTVGGNLAITSLQDQNHYAAQSKSVGGSITIGPGVYPPGVA